MRKQNLSMSGFTLVELAVVMMIVGLLTGGVLKGQELVTNAKVKSTITHIHEMTTAVVAFQEIYGALPGDLKSADRSVPGCTGFCGAGDGNNIVGRSNGLNAGGQGILDALDSQAGVTAMPEVETTWFWQHMMLTGLISGVQVADPAFPTWGVTHPATDMAGGLQVVYLATGAPLEPGLTSGHYVVFRAEMVQWPGGVQGLSGINGFSPGTLATTPFMAQSIDVKMDDGQPLAGFIMAASLVGLGCLPDYDTTERSANCLMAAMIDS